MLAVVNALHRIKDQQNTMGGVFFSFFQFRSFCPLLHGVLIPAKLWAITITLSLPRNSPHLESCLGLRDSSMRIMSENGRMSQNSHHHDEGAKGIDL